MTRLMVWNIQKFAIDKLQTVTCKQQLAGIPNYESSALADYIISSILSEDAAGASLEPDIFVVIEVRAGVAPAGRLITGAGEEGVLHLLDRLQTEVAPDWSVVPPLVLGTGIMAEGIAVYYKNTNLLFTGPYYWNDTTGATDVAPGETYKPPWDGALPEGKGDTRAGQWNFTDAGGRALSFPNPGNRQPFLTTFTETDEAATGTGKVPRNISLYSYHAPVTYPSSRNGTRQVGRIAEIVAGPGANEVMIVAGGFNCNLNNPAQDAGYKSLRAANFTQHFIVADGSTIIKAANPTRRKRGGDANPRGVFPTYGYMSNLAVDNIFTLANPALPPDIPHFVVNHVVGTAPYRFVPPLSAKPPPPPPGVPERPKGNTYQIAMGQSIDLINARSEGADSRLTTFHSLENYGKIGGELGTSDHLALVIDF